MLQEVFSYTKTGIKLNKKKISAPEQRQKKKSPTIRLFLDIWMTAFKTMYVHTALSKSVQ